MNASGALCVTRAELEALGRSRSGAIVTKSMTLEARTGNPEPRYYPFAGGSINSMGLPNLGYRAYAELIPALKTFRKPVIASVAGLCEGDRKSTRLNSSHLVISYSVFCLKKKKTKHPSTPRSS